MPFTTSGIFFRELAGSPTLGADRDSRSGSMDLMLPWNRVDAFLDEILPPPLVIGDFVIHPPRGAMPGRPWLLTDSCTISPWDSGTVGGDPSVPSAAWGKASITFKTFENEDEDEEDPDTFLTHKISIGAEFMTLPQQVVTWSSESEGSDPEPSKSEDVPFSILIPTVEHQFTWRTVINPPFSVIKKTIGHVNKKVIFGAGAETLLFLGVDAQREFTSTGLQPWTLDYRFTERRLIDSGGTERGWNHFFRPSTGAWSIPLVNGKKVYNQKEFLPLFSPAQE